MTAVSTAKPLEHDAEYTAALERGKVNRAHWVSRNGAKLVDNGTWHWLIGKRSNRYYSTGRSMLPEWLPNDDHCSLWRKKDKSLVWVSQPYGITGIDIPCMCSAAKKYGLMFSIDSGLSWHYPGRTLLVEWTKLDTDTTDA